MTHTPPLRGLSLALLLAATFCFQAWAGDGHDHGEAPAAAAGPALPRFTLSSEAFELVGVLAGTRLTLYLDHAADNSPVKNAKLELELGGAAVKVAPHGEGEFEVVLGQPLPPGVVAVTATVLAGSETDLLAGELDIHGETHAEAATQARRWPLPAAAAAAAALALLAAVALRRSRQQRAGAAA